MDISHRQLIKRALSLALKRRRIIACFLMGAITLGLLGYLQLPKKYASHSVLTLQGLDQETGQAPLDLDEQFKGLQGQVLAENALVNIITRVRPFSGRQAKKTVTEQVNLLKNSLSMTLEPELKEIRLGYVGNDPDKVAEVVAALTQRADQVLRASGPVAVSPEVNDQVAAARTLVEEKERAMRTYILENFEAMPEQLEENLARMELLKKKLVEATVSKKKSSQEYLLRKKNLDQETDPKKRVEIQQHLDKLTTGVTVHTSVIERLTRDLEKLQGLVGAAKEHEENWTRLSQDYEQAQVVLEGLLEHQFNQGSPELDDSIKKDSMVISAPSYPLQPFFPRFMYFALVSSLVGLFSGAFFVLYIRFRHKTLLSPFDIERYLDLPVDCSIAYLPLAAERKRARLKILLSAGAILLYAFLLVTVILWLYSRGTLVW